MHNLSLIEKALPKLQCPQCQAKNKLELKERWISCNSCHRDYSIKNGIIDFIPDFPPATSLPQRAMENPLYVKLYETYLRPAFTALGSNISYNDEDKWLANKGTKSDAVLDLASGTGRYSRMLADQLEADIVFSIDISKPMLEQAEKYNKKRGYSNILSIRGDAHNLPLKSNSVNYINCFGALHLMPNTSRVIEELSRIGEEDITFSCMTAGVVKTTIARQLQNLFSKTGSFQFFAPEKLEAILDNNGFTNFQYEMRNMVMLFSTTKHN